MEFHDRDYFVSRILSDYVRIVIEDDVFKLYHPTKETVYEANELVRELRQQLSHLLTDEEIYEILIDRRLWTKKDEEVLNKTLPDNLEKLKIGLFESILQSKQQKTIRKYIEATQKEYDRLYNIRHGHDHSTIDAALIYAKSLFIIEECVRLDSERVDWNCFNINTVLRSYQKMMLSDDIVRELARTTPWAAYWPILKKNGRIFKDTYITLEQQQLAQWSLIYDSAHESPECPPDFVFEDDDMFDGWLLVQKRARQVAVNKNQAEGKISNNPKINQANEIFVVADTSEDAAMIDSLNDAGSSMIKKSRIKQIKKQGIVKEGYLVDVNLDLQARKNRLAAQTIRGGG
jgi:hypothetical protein